MLGSGGVKGGDPNGESDGPLHRDDSTFGEYMAGLDGRSRSGNGVRRLNSSGTCSHTLPDNIHMTKMVDLKYHNNNDNMHHNNRNRGGGTRQE